MDQDEVNPKILVSDEQFTIANTRGWEVTHKTDIPFYGQKIRITDAKDFSKVDYFKLHELNCVLTIIKADPILIGEKDVCYYEYLVYTEEFPDLLIKSWNFEFVPKDKLL